MSDDLLIRAELRRLEFEEKQPSTPQLYAALTAHVRDTTRSTGMPDQIVRRSRWPWVVLIIMIVVAATSSLWLPRV